MKHFRYALPMLAWSVLLLTSSCLTPSFPQVLEFSPTNLPKARLGVFYDVIIKVTRNETPVGEFSISQGSLPNGLKFERLAGQDAARIFGIPEKKGLSKFTINVWCFGTNASGQTGEMQYTIIVSE